MVTYIYFIQKFVGRGYSIQYLQTELLTVYNNIGYFCHFLEAISFHVFTDHKTFLSEQSKQKLSCQKYKVARNTKSDPTFFYFLTLGLIMFTSILQVQFPLVKDTTSSPLVQTDLPIGMMCMHRYLKNLPSDD